MLTKVEAFDYNGGHRIDWVNYTYQAVQSRRSTATGATTKDDVEDRDLQRWHLRNV